MINAPTPTPTPSAPVESGNHGIDQIVNDLWMLLPEIVRTLSSAALLIIFIYILGAFTGMPVLSKIFGPKLRKFEIIFLGTCLFALAIFMVVAVKNAAT